MAAIQSCARSLQIQVLRSHTTQVSDLDLFGRMLAEPYKIGVLLLAWQSREGGLELGSMAEQGGRAARCRYDMG